MAKICLSDMTLAVVALACAGLLVGCTNDAATVVPEPAEKPTVAGFTHDGAVPISVIGSFEDLRRSSVGTDADVAAAAACTYLTTSAQERTVSAARRNDLVGGKADCAQAMRALVERRDVPVAAEVFEVVRAEDEVSEVVVVRGDGTAELYTLTGSVDDAVWSIDSIAKTDPPVVEVSDPAIEPEAGVEVESGVEGDR